ncbi:hypothetical protein X801_06867, partial [Opisthorchis viverrini]
EYPQWLWTLRTDRRPPPLDQVDRNSYYFWRRVRRDNFRHWNHLASLDGWHRKDHRSLESHANRFYGDWETVSTDWWNSTRLESNNKIHVHILYVLVVLKNFAHPHPQYVGPYLVTSRHPKYFITQFNNKTATVSIDRLKSAYTDFVDSGHLGNNTDDVKPKNNVTEDFPKQTHAGLQTNNTGPHAPTVAFTDL